MAIWSFFYGKSKLTFLSGHDCKNGAVWQDSIHFIFGYLVDSAKVKKVSHNRPSLFLHLYSFYLRTFPPSSIEHLIELQKKLLLMASKVKDIVTKALAKLTAFQISHN